MGFTDDAVPSTLFIDTYLVTRAEQKSIKPFRDCLAEEPFGATALVRRFWAVDFTASNFRFPRMV